MRQRQIEAQAPDSKIRRFRGRVGKAPEFERSKGGVAVCRLVVVGKAAGVASKPKSANVYLRGVEAVRCGLGLNEGDVIEGAGVLKPKRKGAPRREIVVKDERVILRARAAVAV